MTAVAANMDTQLPSLRSAPDVDSMDPNDNVVMMEEDEPLSTPTTTASSNRTVSPLPCRDTEPHHMVEDDILQPCNSFDQWQKEHDWDDVVLMVGPHDEDEHMDDVLLDDRDTEYRISLLDDAGLATSSSDVPLVDEFLVRQSGQAEIELSCLKGHDLMPPVTSSSTLGDAETKLDLNENQRRTSAKVSKHKNLSPLPPPKVRPYEDQYTKRLCRLKESMHRSRQSRRSLCVSSPQTERYPRRKSVSQVLHSIESSSHQIHNCYLDPRFFLQRQKTV